MSFLKRFRGAALQKNHVFIKLTFIFSTETPSRNMSFKKTVD